MATDPPPSSGAAARSIFDDQHYAFHTRSPHSDTLDSNPPSRRPSTFDRGHSPIARNVVTMQHSASIGNGGGGGGGALMEATSSGNPMLHHMRTPSEAHSIQSNSSSLRQAYDVLRGGVFPPGVRTMRGRDGYDETGSDGSHYDDEDGYSFEGEGPFQTSSPKASFSAAAASSSQQQSTDEYANALDSPTVPERRSSAAGVPTGKLGQFTASDAGGEHGRKDSLSKSVNQSRLLEDDLPSASEKTAAGRKKSFSRSSVRRTDLVSASSEQPSPRSATFPSPERQAEHGSIKADESVAQTTTTDEAELERRLEAAADADPSRPRTLKEARALAKERARQRLQAKESGDNSDALASTNIADAETQRQANRHVQVFQTSSGEKRDSTSTPVVPVILTQDKKISLDDMSDLQAAVGEALEDVSFTSGATSTTATTSTATALDSSSPAPTSMTVQTTTLSVPTSDAYLGAKASEADVESIAPSTQSFDSALESPFTSAAQIPPVAAFADNYYETETGEGQPPTIQVIHTAPNHLQQTPSFTTPKATSFAAGHPEASSTKTQQFVPHSMLAQQRSTAPNKIARLDVYGKTVPFPAAFDPSAIVEQRRLAPWERARSYAHYCNDLMSTPTGLQVWLEMVQRPAQRIAAASSVAPSTSQGTSAKRHVRGEATDGSTYAASVRSDATFPVRGDGGKAKEIVSHHPAEASIPESPPAGLPQNLPYPILAGGGTVPTHHQQQSPTTSSGVRHQSRPSQDNAISVNSVDRQNSRNFFSNLGRRSSARRPTQGGLGGLTNVASNSPAKAGISSIRSRGISMPKSPSLDISPPSSDPASLATSFVSPPQSASATSATLPTSASSTSSMATRNGPQGPRAPPNNPSPLANAPSYFGSLSNPSPHSSSPSASSTNDKVGLHGLSPTGGLYSIPGEAATSNNNLRLSAPTDYSSGEKRSPRGNTAPLPASVSVKSSLAYGSVRDVGRRPTMPPMTGANASSLQPPSTLSSSQSNDSHGSGGGKSSAGPFGGLGRRRSSNISTTPMTPEESDALDKLCDVLPDADRTTLLEYLRRAHGNDLVAIGDYLQDQSKAESSKLMR